MKGKRRFEDHASKRVSFILPTKNRARQLREALIRCRDLVKPEDELIVVDGASEDDTDQVVEEFSDLVDVYVAEADTGNPEGYNKGSLLARGKYIKNLADDDIFFPEAVEQAVQVMEENPEVDLLVCGGTRLRNGKESFIYVPAGSTFGRSVDHVYKYTRSGAGFLFRKRLLHRVGLYEVNSVSCDAAFLLRSISLDATVRFCRINMFYHRMGEDSFSMRNRKEKLLERDRLIRMYCSKRFQREWFLKRSMPGRVARRIRCLLAGRRELQSDESQAPVWDGGFS